MLATVLERRIPSVAVFLTTLTTVAGCAPHGTTSSTTTAPLTERVSEMETDDYHSSLSLENVRGVMHAKLVHVHALFEGMVTEDLRQVAENADELRLLSVDSAFRPHRTVAYGVFSDEFGTLAGRIAESARRDDLDAVNRDYVRLTNTCVQCHAYLRKEHLKLDLPGAVSMRRTTIIPE